MKRAGRQPTILLVHPPSDCVTNDRLEPNLGLLYVASCLREAGYDHARLYDMTGCSDATSIATALAQIPDADIYGISCLSTNYPYARAVVQRVKARHPAPYVVLGGPHPSGVPELAYPDSGADAIVTGEGEDALCGLVDALTQGRYVTGIVPGTPREDIDTYPFPARNLADDSTYARRLAGHPVVSLLGSRGCVHHCLHCNSIVMGGGSHRVRYRSAESIAREIESLRDAFDCYRFNDDHFTGHPCLEQVLQRVKDLHIQFRVFARVEDLSVRVCRWLREAGCVHVSVGLESLNPDNLRVLGKGTQIGQEHGVVVAMSEGLVVRCSFMVGLPYDNDRTIEGYFGQAAQLHVDEFAVYPLIPYPGTRLRAHPEKYGYTIVDHDCTHYVQMGKGGAACYALQHENFGPQDVRRWRERATELLEAGGSQHMRGSPVAT
jgi:anaerobic magnesium-protoporphyrin IX monomethyl ester cyclase